MKMNVGTIDRVVRAVIGLVFIALSATATVGWWGYVVGGILAATAAVSFCPIWAMLGINTRSDAPKPQ